MESKKIYIKPQCRTIPFTFGEFFANTGGDIHGPGGAPPVIDPGGWDTRKLDLDLDMDEGTSSNYWDWNW
ncbi:hypothetical protein C7Y71_005735 [Pseudoprevotella muciniphila]|uniref:Uncharacterized protein n=1 Tax=Pseudoprevotella muciniphila TaxID=2133944 RepID=A0A5P8E6B1_9BACT|nr:hypothetical protein [Pseudoprevotella muciniphila]QFQ12553.1 hypothetical protein C7Y71_005735 [Pseudoprevotella muciniphila]